MGKAIDTICRGIDGLNLWIGKSVAWLTLLMVLVTFVVVVLRYAFGSGVIWLQESLTWMHAAAFMLGMAYTLQMDEHVRVDVYYRGMSERSKAIVNLCGVLVFLLPLCVFLIYLSFNYVMGSWTIGETSRDAGGLPYPAVPLLKGMLVIMPAAVGLQGISILLRSLRTIWPVSNSGDEQR